MTVNLQVYSKASALVQGRVVGFGSLDVPASIEITGDKFEKTVPVANAANTVMYADELGGFNYLAIASDYDTRILLTDTGGDTFSLQIRGSGTSNEPGPPQEFFQDHTSDDTDRINAVRVFNESGNAAQVSLVVLE